MSTIVAQTLSNGSVSTSTANCIQGSAKAWVNFDGTGTVAIRASFNVSSITDNGLGDYTVNFTNALTDANYATQITGKSSGPATGFIGTAGNATQTTTQLRVIFIDDAGASRDTVQGSVAIFR